MTEVEFDEDQSNDLSKYQSRVVLGGLATPGLVLWMVRKGLVKDEGKATRILIILIIICFVVSGVIFYFTSQKPASSKHIIFRQIVVGATK